MNDITSIFKGYAEELEKEQSIRENLNQIVRQLDRIYHSVSTTLEKIHHKDGILKLDAICLGCLKELAEVPECYKNLSQALPKGDFHLYHPCFKNTCHKIVFLHAFLIYLNENRLGTYEEISSRMGLSTADDESLHLELEDYLYGCLFLGNELSRLTINAVSSGNYTMPFQISQFLRELHASYSLLNPKNDLRKKFDELKYSLKKTEEVVFNLSLRGMKATSEDTSG